MSYVSCHRHVFQRLACFVAGLCLVWCHLQAADDTPPPAAPLAADRTEIDLGDVFLGQTVQFEFTLKNTTSQPLRIHAHANCGCTVAEHADSIPARGEEKLKAVLNTTALHLGPLVKAINVTTETTRQKPLHLTLKANLLSVVQRLDTNRRPISAVAERNVQREMRLRVRGPGPVEITSASCNHSWATARVEPLPCDDQPGRLYKLMVTIDRSAPPGRTPLTVQLDTTYESERAAHVNLTIEKGILVSPSAIVLKSDLSQPKIPATAAVNLVRRDGQFHIKKVECREFELESFIDTVVEGHEYRLRLVSRGQRQAGVRQRQGIVRIETDDPLQPVIEIKAISMFVPPPTKSSTTSSAPSAASIPPAAQPTTPRQP